MDNRAHSSWPTIYCVCHQCSRVLHPKRNMMAISGGRRARHVSLFTYTTSLHNGIDLDLGTVSSLIRELEKVRKIMEELEEVGK